MKRLIKASSAVKDAGMILELFGDAVSEIKLPEGFVWDYKIDELENGDPAGQCFIMTEDNQPVAFFTFSLMIDGKPLEIYRDKRDAEFCDQLSRKLQKAVDSLGDLEIHVGKPASRTLELTGKVEGSTSRKFKKIPTNIQASKDMGLTSQDDPLLYGFMYEYTKHYDELPDYDTVLDEWDGSVSESEWKKAYDRLSYALDKIEYYSELHRERYIELSDNATFAYIDVLDSVVSKIGEEAIENLYEIQVEDAKEEFYGRTGTEIYLFGRSGRHVCVEDDVQNALRYEYLKECVDKLEQQIINRMNNLTIEDVY